MRGTAPRGAAAAAPSSETHAGGKCGYGSHRPASPCAHRGSGMLRTLPATPGVLAPATEDANNAEKGKRPVPALPPNRLYLRVGGSSAPPAGCRIRPSGKDFPPGLFSFPVAVLYPLSDAYRQRHFQSSYTVYGWCLPFPVLFVSFPELLHDL